MDMFWLNKMGCTFLGHTDFVLERKPETITFCSPESRELRTFKVRGLCCYTVRVDYLLRVVRPELNRDFPVCGFACARFKGGPRVSAVPAFAILLRWEVLWESQRGGSREEGPKYGQKFIMGCNRTSVNWPHGEPLLCCVSVLCVLCWTTLSPGGQIANSERQSLCCVSMVWTLCFSSPTHSVAHSCLSGGLLFKFWCCS